MTPGGALGPFPGPPPTTPSASHTDQTGLALPFGFETETQVGETGLGVGDALAELRSPVGRSSGEGQGAFVGDAVGSRAMEGGGEGRRCSWSTCGATCGLGGSRELTDVRECSRRGSSWWGRDPSTPS